MSLIPNSRQIMKLNICNYCQYKCSKISDLNKHFLTKKHKKNYQEINPEINNVQENSKKSPNHEKIVVFYNNKFFTKYANINYL